MIKTYLVTFAELIEVKEGKPAYQKTEVVIRDQIGLDLLLSGYDRKKFELINVQYIGEDMHFSYDYFMPKTTTEKGIN